MGFQDVVFLPSPATFFITFLIKLNFRTITCLIAVFAGKQGHAHCKIFLLQQIDFLCHNIEVNPATIIFWGYCRILNSGVCRNKFCFFATFCICLTVFFINVGNIFFALRLQCLCAFCEGSFMARNFMHVFAQPIFKI